MGGWCVWGGGDATPRRGWGGRRKAGRTAAMRRWRLQGPVPSGEVRRRVWGGGHGCEGMVHTCHAPFTHASTACPFPAELCMCVRVRRASRIYRHGHGHGYCMRHARASVCVQQRQALEWDGGAGRPPTLSVAQYAYCPSCSLCTLQGRPATSVDRASRCGGKLGCSSRRGRTRRQGRPEEGDRGQTTEFEGAGVWGGACCSLVPVGGCGARRKMFHARNAVSRQSRVGEGVGRGWGAVRRSSMAGGCR